MIVSEIDYSSFDSGSILVTPTCDFDSCDSDSSDFDSSDPVFRNSDSRDSNLCR